MDIYYSKIQEWHNPPFEGYSQDGYKPSLEKPERALIMLEELKKTGWANILPPKQFDLEPIYAVHSSLYLEYIKSAYQDWVEFSPVPQMAFIPGTMGFSHSMIHSGGISEAHGFFLLDTTVAINKYTYNAALNAANCALSGAHSITQGSTVFALCRPPGHHAGREICGGYCFLNNTAIAAQWFSNRGKVAILDIDYHVGNGTQEIFYERSDVFTISLHADPRHEYPYYAGYAHEIGSGNGKGFNRNFPLPAGISDNDYLVVLDHALGLIDYFSPDYLVIPIGMDIHMDDPLGDFSITTEGIYQIGERIADLNLPTLVVMEGGYHIPSLGKNVVAFLTPFASSLNNLESE